MQSAYVITPDAPAQLGYPQKFKYLDVDNNGRLCLVGLLRMNLLESAQSKWSKRGREKRLSKTLW